MRIQLQNCEFILLPEKALYRPDESLLVIADVHLGKARHFRSEGIAIPASAQNGDYEKLRTLFDKFHPFKVYFLGDLFHSRLNNDWQLFESLINQYPHITFTLVKGNHDIINKTLFQQLHIQVVNHIEDKCFIYSHEPLKENASGKVNIAGHIHPGIHLSGKANQSLRLPCFYSTGTTFILPAFGSLTGLFMMDRNNDTEVYVVLPDNIKKI